MDAVAKQKESSEVVKGRIMDAAARLFAQHGVNGVSTRRIAEEARTNSALIFRYFGSKDKLVREILQRELSTLKTSYSFIPIQPSAALENLRRLLLIFLKENQGLVKLIVRSQLDGLSPEAYVNQSSERLATTLATWIESQQTRKGYPDARLVSIVVIGTLMSLVCSAPWLMTSVGFETEDFDKYKEEIIDVLLWVIAQAIGFHAGALHPSQTNQNSDTEKIRN